MVLGWGWREGSRAGEFWQNFANRIRDEHWQRIQELAKDDLVIATNSFWNGKITIDTLLSWFGANAIFGKQRFRVFAQIVSTTPAAEWLLRNFLDADRDSVRWDAAAAFESIGAWLTTAKPPWIKRSEVRHAGRGLAYVPRRVVAETAFSSNQVFAIFGSFAVTVELLREHADELLREFKSIKTPLVTGIMQLIRVRSTGAASLPGLSLENEIGVTPQQADIIRRWMNGTIDFVRNE